MEVERNKHERLIENARQANQYNAKEALRAIERNVRPEREIGKLDTR